MIEVSFNFDKLALRAVLDRSPDLTSNAWSWFVHVRAGEEAVAEGTWNVEHMRVDGWRTHGSVGDYRRKGSRDEALRARVEELLRVAVVANALARVRLKGRAS